MSFHQSSGKCYLYLKDNKKALSYGDKLEFTAYLFQSRTSDSYENFNFAQYLKKQQIRGLLSLRELKGVQNSPSLWSRFYNEVLYLRSLVLDRITRTFSSEKRAILESILFSKKDSLEYEKKVQYLESGLLHLFAVSGFHVGIVAFIYNNSTSNPTSSLPLKPRTLINHNIILHNDG